MNINSLYLPDVFYFKTTLRDSNVDLKINYNDIGDVSTENVKGKILQSLLLYDSLYIHAWDLPVLIHFFEGKGNAELITEKGLLRLLNCEDKFMGCKKYSELSTLAGGQFIRDVFSCEDDINNMLQSFKGNYNDYALISKHLYHTSLKIDTNDMFELLEREIINDLSNEEFRINNCIVTKKANQIYPQDVPYINSLLETHKRIVISQKANLNNIFTEDVLVKFLKDKIICSNEYKELRFDINKEFSNLTKCIAIPDIVEAVNENILSVKDILEIREKKNCREFREWLNNKVYYSLSDKENLSVVKAYIDALEKKDLIDKMPIKIIRFVSTSSIGLVPGIGGIIASFLDTFIIGKFRGWKPQIFIDDYRKCVKII